MSNQSGFSLIEIAIGMAVIGLIASALIQAYKIYRVEHERTQERIVQEKITTALATYLQQNNRYPCPASLTQTPNTTGFGRAPATCNTGTFVTGALPVVDLNLPFDMVEDEYGNKLTYVVTAGMTDRTTFNSTMPAIALQGFALDNDGKVTTTLTTKNLPFIIVGHGPDMKGSYRTSGTAVNVACGSAADSENCDGDATFNARPYSPMANVNNANHFDDMLIYSLVQKETTLWAIAPADGGASGINIISRNTGNIGIGTDNPAAKLSVHGGDFNVEAAGAGASGNITTTGTIDIEKNAKLNAQSIDVTQDINAESEMSAGTAIKATRFCYNIDIADCN
ncbi:type II secretion system protein [Micavibrio aeruginosavorus]|uniref:type II secretion system protein n=1 Tax=Micavibrio aeruginosavorus TaxID=349221 RepID=UPI003F4A8E12